MTFQKSLKFQTAAEDSIETDQDNKSVFKENYKTRNE